VNLSAGKTLTETERNMKTFGFLVFKIEHSINF
jgi:hypothetical protein